MRQLTRSTFINESCYMLTYRLASKISFLLILSWILGAWTMSTSGGQTSQSLVAYATPPVVGYGSAPLFSANQQVGNQPIAPNSLVDAMVMSPDGKGYWLATATGEVLTYGDAVNFGSLINVSLYAPIVGMAATPDGKGYWMVASDGGIFTFGDATFYGSMGGKSLNGPIVGMAATPDGKGYWMVASDGGIFTFGDATFYGSMGGKYLAGAIVGMAATPDGKGYWMVGADGGIFTFGDATFFGSMGGTSLNSSVVAMAPTATSKGYWMVGGDGGIFAFGDATFYGSLGANMPSAPIQSMIPTPSGDGYYLLSPDSFTYNFTPTASERLIPQSNQIVAAAESQIGPTSSPGSFCNPYGPCEEWCALFVSWTWNQAGIASPADGFTGALFDWVSSNERELGPNDMPAEGDFLFYGTGPQSSSTSVHMGVVVQTWGNGSLLTIEGDSGPGNAGYLGVTVNGSFLISHSLEYNGDPVYGFGEPIS